MFFRRKPFNACPLCKGSFEYKFKPTDMKIIMKEEYENLLYQISVLDKQVQNLSITLSRTHDEKTKLQEIISFDPKVIDKYDMITQKFKHDLETTQRMLNIKDV